MILSGVIVLAFAAFGIDDKGLTFLTWHFDTPLLTTRIIPAEKFYKYNFATFAVPVWLMWAATILALISTSSIFPDFIAGGSIELTLSKPISRVRLFATKYILGLMFAALQVFVFSLACFLVIGIRGHSWEPSLFLAVPIVTLFFSYLFAMCVLLGLTTRSTITSLLVTIVIWLALWSINTTDKVFLVQRVTADVNAERAQKRVERAEGNARKQLETMRAEGKEVPVNKDDAGGPDDELEAVNPFLKNARREADESKEAAGRWARYSGLVVIAKTVLPKTSDTGELLDRWLLTAEDRRLIEGRNRKQDVDIDTRARFGAQDPEVERRAEEAVRGRTVGWVIGTSLLFEGVVLGIGAWVFARRDFLGRDSVRPPAGQRRTRGVGGPFTA